LWHVVVDTDETASRLLKTMNAEKTGRVTFMPLNRLRPKAAPPVNAQDAIPLLSKIAYDPLYAKAFQQVFGRTCVCRDLTLAAAYVKSHGINTITLDGDKVDHKGALSGGYHDVRRSRLDAIRALSNWRTKSDADEGRHKEVKATILELDQQIARLAGQIQVLTSQLAQQKHTRDGLGNAVGALRDEKERVKERIEKLEAQVEDTEGELQESDTQTRSLREELQTPMVGGLTDEEEATIERLNREVDQRTTGLTQRTNEKLEVSGRKSLVEIRLNEDLKRRRAEIIEMIERLGEPQNADYTAAEDLESRARELQTLKNTIESLKAKSLGTQSLNRRYPNGLS
jgi:structural maintenance of chromosome 3 (chondroitin sulfate proteoglycan 6)